MATIRDVAKRAGVSISTVSLVVNGTGSVTLETARRVRAVAAELGYAANPMAQALKSGRTRMMGVAVTGMANPFFARVLKTFEQQALARNYLVVVSDTDCNADREVAVLEHLAAQRVAGALFAPSGSGEIYQARLADIRMPLVQVDQKVPGLARDHVGTENRIAGAMLAEHLLRLGHRRIAFLGGAAGLWTADERRLGVVSTLACAGVEPDPTMLVDANFESEPAYEHTVRLLTRPDRPTAILCANNLITIGALEAISHLGFRCPDDISLAAIDEVPWANVIKPRITMVVQQSEDIGRLACQWLLDRIDGNNAEPPRERLFVPRLIAGESCRPPAN